MLSRFRSLVVALTVAILSGQTACTGAPEPLEARIRRVTTAIDDARLTTADRDTANWLTYGRTYDERRHSPLDQISDTNVDQLGLLWSLELGTKRGLEATPIVVDGVMFFTGTWSVVHAVDARTGSLIWRHDPGVPRDKAKYFCCDVVNRGVAVYKGKVYSGVLDGRMIALDAATGAPVWSVWTVDTTMHYSITGAPRIVKGRVVIGNGGAEYGVRGYVSAYDAETGKLEWRVYTVPGDPSRGFESPALETAASTWSGEWWTAGGGGTAWDAIVYDPELDLLYIGTGNGSPWNRHVRSPGGGDNLYLASILALNPDDGTLVWHYQTTPGDNWDYTATQPLMLADLAIDGEMRQVIMQAPKNGFFFVLDRKTGEFLSARPYVDVTWATGIDMAGRPLENPAATVTEAFLVSPGPGGAHNWMPMSFDPASGLVFFPAREEWFVHNPDSNWTYDSRTWNMGIDVGIFVDLPEHLVPPDPTEELVAWDPVAQEARWRVPMDAPWNGGTLSTAGNLVFHGTATGKLVAYRTTDGEKLWEGDTGTGIIAAPVTYLVDGEQYVSVLAGWGGPPLLFNEPAFRIAAKRGGRLVTFALGGMAALNLPPKVERPPPVPAIEVAATPDEIKEGNRLYGYHCIVCHGMDAVSGGAVPDLRYASKETHERFEDIVLGGALRTNGMPPFARQLSSEDVRLIQKFVLAKATAAQRDATAASP